MSALPSMNESETGSRQLEAIGTKTSTSTVAETEDSRVTTNGCSSTNTLEQNVAGLAVSFVNESRLNQDETQHDDPLAAPAPEVEQNQQQGKQGVEEEDEEEEEDKSSDVSDDPNDDSGDDDSDSDAQSKGGRQVWRMRWLLVGVYVAVAVAVCLTVYRQMKKNEDDSFERNFKAFAVAGLVGFNRIGHYRFGLVGHFVMSISTYLKSAPDAEWPFVVLPHWAYRAAKTTDLGDFFSLAILPRVQEDQRERWEAFAVNNTLWFKESLAVLEQVPVDEIEEELHFPQTILKWTSTSTGQIPEDPNSGPYYPLWQHFPPIPNATYGHNLYAHPQYSPAIRWILQTQNPSLTASTDLQYYSETDARRIMFQQFIVFYNSRNGGTSVTYQNDPICPLLYPIFRNHQEMDEIIGLVLASVYWRTFFREILPAQSEGIIVVLSNTCGQQFTYRIEGRDVQFIGYGDLHDSSYDSLAMVAEDIAGNILGSIDADDVSDGICSYNIHLYPSSSFEDAYVTNEPAIYATSMAAAFICAFLLFALYDRCLVQRHELIKHSAARAQAIVSSIFPEEVCDRLYEEEEQKKNSRFSEKPRTSAAIAKLYPACTVAYVEIVGFDKWNSSRTAQASLDLLEKIFGEFDDIGIRLGVTKIESVGARYLAAGGLPEPLGNHATVMVNFADACLRRMEELLESDLPERLGDDTRELSVRFGLNSGAVMAGVLGGRVSRFQMFGDAVNTASHMMHSSFPGRIHISQQTRDLLVLSDNNKSEWVCPRDDLVLIKGKGEVQTYWVRVANNNKDKNDNNKPLIATSATATETSDKDAELNKQVDLVGKTESL